MQSINPATGKLIKEYQEYSKDQISQIIDRANTAGLDWKQTTFAQRQKLFAKLKHHLLEQKHDLAKLMTQEMGKPLSQAIAEVEKCGTACDYYIENAATLLSNQKITDGDDIGYVCFQPLGVILGIMPWNFPYWQVFRYAVPAIMAGNTTILKHAGNVSGCALAIESLFKEAGFPQGVFTTLLVDSKNVADIIADPRIKAVTLTGSTTAGKSVATEAGKYLKKCVLELGGSDPYIILEDADLEKAVEICTKGRLQNTGQSCIAAKRFIVVETIYKEFEQLLFEAFDEITYGDPMNGKHLLGPLARHDLRDALNEQVLESVEQGADLLIGGYIPDNPGAYYPATILTNVKPGTVAYEQELFGPVAIIITARNESEAIRIANDSDFGLGACVLTKDMKKGQKIAEFDLEAGNCFVNKAVHSDTRFPFGGIKQSGFGRELGEFGIREFVNIKTVRVWKS